jgi:pimeloyl-ACP methyl ester carboxylesterase
MRSCGRPSTALRFGCDADRDHHQDRIAHVSRRVTYSIPTGSGKDPIADDAVAATFLFHDCDGGRSSGRSRPAGFLPRAVHHERISLAPEVPSTYVVAGEDRTIRPDWQRRMARERLSVEPLGIATGHCPNVSEPDRLAGILVEVAERA